MKAIETYLPVFPGFYETWFSYDDEIEQELDELGTTWDNIEWDNKTFQNDIASECVDFLEEKLKELGLVDRMTYKEVVSPREYNFRTDSINVEMGFSRHNFDAIKSYIYDNRAEFTVYVEEHCTSRPGFSSFLPNTFDGWAEITGGFYFGTETEKRPTTLGMVLEFICQQEEIDHQGMYEYCRERVFAGNYITVKENQES